MQPEDLCLLISKLLSADYSEKGKGFVLNEQSLSRLISDTTSIFDYEPAFLELDGTFNIIGDLHGDIVSLLRIFDHFGYPSSKNRFLLLGDYVDRGKFSIEVLELLFSLKLLYPNSIYLLKGNHECTDICSNYGFRQECLKRSTHAVFEAFCEAFSSLPICATIGNKAFCVHGGISPQIKSKKNLEELEKCDIPEPKSIIADMLWSDPSDDVAKFGPSKRIIGHVFGSEAAAKIMDLLDVFVIIRAHESIETGFDSKFGVITVFSTADYCGMGNTAAALTLPDDANLESDIEIELFRPLMKKKFLPKVPEFIRLQLADPIQFDEIALNSHIVETLCS